MAIIINFCPTGMVPTKAMTPYVPESPAEIIEQVHEAYELGITIAHLHARDETGVPTWKKDIYARIFEGVRVYCPELLICGSTSGRTFPEFEKRSALIELQPDMASLTLSSLNFAKEASVNPPDIIARLAMKMREYGVNPELECFDLGMINYGKYLISKSLIEGPCYWNVLFGNIAGLQATPSQIGIAMTEIPSNHYLAFAGIGGSQLQVAAIAISLGVGVRIGIEDNIWLDQQRTRLATNIELVRRVHQLMEIHEEILMPPGQLGKMGFYNKQKLEVIQ
ncbi:MAG: 3-keto-5-aminohexanoate cleavage protein [Haliscomenobacteraceae bacterium CHB4]|nr:3-keto-5-aminohexanoate cleavage protein [Haliscomenobacteraceae bacterium CHB4]